MAFISILNVCIMLSGAVICYVNQYFMCMYGGYI